MFLLRRPRLVLALAANESYALGLAVTVRSVLETLHRRWDVTVYVLDGGIADDTKRAVLASWKGFPCDATFVQPELERVRHLKLTQGMTAHTYARLLVADTLPEEDRVLYLDSDMLALADLGELWETDLEGKSLGAVQDVLISKTLSDIPHWDTLKLDPHAPYFSGALLLLDAAEWRTENMGQRVIGTIAAHPDSIRWWDQDGLNITIAGDFSQLDPRWNVYAESAALLGWKPAPEQEAMTHKLVAQQRVVHFATRYKPWKFDCPHPKTAAFLDVMDRTAWKGWRPKPETRVPFPLA